MGITMNRFDGSEVTPTSDAIIFEKAIPTNGILHGCAISHITGNQISLGSGRIIIKGRDCIITEETINAMLPPSTSGVGRLYVRIDLFDLEAPAEILTVAVNGSTLPALTQNENFNTENGIWEEELATYTASTTAITALTVKAVQVGGKKLLWTNPNPTSAISAGQIYSADLSVYSYIEVEFKLINSASNFRIDKFKRLSDSVLTYINNSIVACRNIGIADAYVQLAAGQKKAHTATSFTDDNNYCIPTRIWGLYA